MVPLKAFIEIPDGDDRRRHLHYDKSCMIDLGPIKEKISANNGKCPGNYGFIMNTTNEEEGDELDVIVFSSHKLEITQELVIKPFAMFVRRDLDHKVLAINAEENSSWKSISSIPEDYVQVLIEFYGASSPIIKCADKKETLEYIKKCEHLFNLKSKLQKKH